MINILSYLKKYSPKYTNRSTFSIVLFGDGLTAQRIDGAKSLRSASDFEHEKLPEFVPGVGCWHKRVLLMQIDFKKLFIKSELSSAAGTLPFIKTRFNHKKVNNSAKTCFNEATKMYKFATVSYLCALACRLMHINDFNRKPSEELLIDEARLRIFFIMWRLKLEILDG